MLDSKALAQIARKGISETQIEEQLACFLRGFPFLEITASASVEKGINVISKEEQDGLMNEWDDYLRSEKRVFKFVPASGAASRMFKNLYEFLDSPATEPVTPFERQFFDGLTKFAFYEALNACCLEKDNKDIPALLSEKKYKRIVSLLLNEEGLNYGQLPKGVLLFHRTGKDLRTAMEEHLAEGALYAKNKLGKVNLHFTVSPEHRVLFERLVQKKQEAFEKRYSVDYDISFSVQKESTDTIAVDMDNRPFLNKDGSLLFRPGGHGALIENLNEIDADIIFVKNIDNVVPDSFKFSTVAYKKIISRVVSTPAEKDIQIHQTDRKWEVFASAN